MTDDEKQQFIRNFSPRYRGYYLYRGKIWSQYGKRSHGAFIAKLIAEYVAGLAHSDGIPTKGVSPSGQVGCGSPDDNGVQLPGPPSSPRPLYRQCPDGSWIDQATGEVVHPPFPANAMLSPIGEGGGGRRPDIQITYMTTGFSYKQVFKRPPKK